MQEGVMEGGCFCGRIRYRTNGEAIARTLCHCRSCRRASGGVNVAWAVFQTEAYEQLSGDVRWYSSSPGIRWGFCGTCGSLVLYRRDSRPDHTDITTASLDDADALAPTVEIWTEAKLAWERLNEAIPQKPRSSLNE
jgi:hypothetical protein